MTQEFMVPEVKTNFIKHENGKQYLEIINNKISNSKKSKNIMTKNKKENVIEKNPERVSRYVSLPTSVVTKLGYAVMRSPPKFNFRIELAFFFLHLVALRRLRDPNNDDLEEEYVRLDSKLLQHYSYNSKEYFDYFVKSQILKKRNYSTDKARSNSYSFTDQSDDNFNLFTKVDLISLRNLKNIEVVDKYDGKIEKCEHLVKWFYEGLTIDYNGVLCEIQKETNFLKKQSAFVSIQKLMNKELWFKRNSKSDNRLHTWLTNFPKKYRKFLRFNDEKLINHDIKASQPYFLVALTEELLKEKQIRKKVYSTLMFKNLKNITQILHSSAFKQEYEMIKKWILQDDFYTKISEVMFDNQETLERMEWIGKGRNAKPVKISYQTKREMEKKLTLRLFYIDTNSSSFKKDNDFKKFDEKFPQFSRFLKELKKHNYKDLSKLMQNKEAYCILDVVTKEISCLYPDMPLFTIHDSIMTTQYWAKEVNLGKLIQEIMFRENGVQPQINIE